VRAFSRYSSQESNGHPRNSGAHHRDNRARRDVARWDPGEAARPPCCDDSRDSDPRTGERHRREGRRSSHHRAAGRAPILDRLFQNMRVSASRSGGERRFGLRGPMVVRRPQGAERSGSWTSPGSSAARCRSCRGGRQQAALACRAAGAGAAVLARRSPLEPRSALRERTRREWRQLLKGWASPPFRHARAEEAFDLGDASRWITRGSPRAWRGAG